MVHTLKYVTRSTFVDYEWDIDMALELRGFRNMVVWGRGLWDGPPVWSLAELDGKAKAEVEGLEIEAIDSLGAGVCPVCGEGVIWGGVLPMGLLNMVQKEDLGAGYYRLADLPPPREVPLDVRERMARLELVKVAREMDSLAGHRREAVVEDEWREERWNGREEWER
jgi:hypothetical protein